MRSTDIFRYPVLTEDLFRRIGYTLDTMEFSYTDRYGQHSLTEESLQGSSATVTRIQLNDERQIWHPDTDTLDVEISGEIESPMFLFGKKGLLPSEGSRLGIGLIWTDQKSRIRGSQTIGSIASDRSENAEFRARIHFDPGVLRGILLLRIVLYVDLPGRNNETQKGTVVGVLDDILVVIEGSGSVFPVAEVDAPGMPLWWIETLIEDPNTDRFDEEHFILNLNRAHCLYPELKAASGEQPPLLKEVLGSSIFTLVQQVLRCEGGREAIRNAEDAEAGSMAKILNYMAVTGKWLDYLDQPEKLSREIHKWVEKEF